MREITMILNIEELTKIQETLNKFPDVKTFELIDENACGIGSTLSLKFAHKIHDIFATLTIVISGVEDW